MDGGGLGPRVDPVNEPGFEPSDDLDLNIMNFMRKKPSPLAMPQHIESIDQLPQARSGKIIQQSCGRRSPERNSAMCLR